MKVSEHLLNDIKPLQLSLNVGAALELMMDLRLSHLPVVHDNKYVGLLSEDDLLEIEVAGDSLERHQKLLKPYGLREDDHLFDAVRVLGEGQLSLLPVISAEGRYVGYIAPLDLLHDMGRELTFGELGSLIVLRVSVRDYHLSQLAQIVESEDARILGLHLLAEGHDFMRLVLKINQRDITRIIKSLERFEYQVLEVYHQSIFDDTASDRYESLMKYLNI